MIFTYFIKIKGGLLKIFRLYATDTFMTLMLWKYVIKTIVVLQRFLLTNILNHIAEITIEFFRYDIRIITDSTIDVQHLAFIITLRFIINKWFYGIPG